MRLDNFRSLIEDSNQHTNVANAFRKALQKSINEFIEPSKLDKNERWMRDNMKWITERCKNNIALVNILASNFFSTIQSIHYSLSKKLPIEIRYLGGLYWAEKYQFDKWLENIKEYGFFIDIQEVKPGSTDEFYPSLISRYMLRDTKNP